MCPGGVYGVSIKFPERRLALVTATAGYMGSDKRCWNRLYSGDKALYDGFQTNITVPCTAAGQPLIFKVTSAWGAKDAYHQTTAQIPVAYTNGPCAAVTAKAKCKPVTDPKLPKAAKASDIPVTKMTSDGIDASDRVTIIAVPAAATAATAAAAAADALQGDQQGARSFRAASGDTVQMRPVLRESSRAMMVYLHGALMLTAFALLMPLGALLARHRWVFGRDPRTGKVFGSWVWVHVAVQALAVLCGAAGIVLAILSTGWKKLPSVPLYEPHKWLGIATLASALVQAAAAPFLSRAAPEGAGAVPKGLPFLHRAWGRVTVAAGVANVFIGTVLIHDLRGQSFVNFLVPAAACTGAVLLLAALLEAMRLQMLRTHRYDPKAGAMAEVFDAYHRSGKRAGAGAAGSGSDVASTSGAGSDV